MLKDSVLKKSYISVNDFSNEEFYKLFNDAAKIKNALDHKRNPLPSSWLNKLRHKWNRAAYRAVCSDATMASIFIEPSTRTSMSHRIAFELLGGTVDHIDIQASSIAKGESLRRTVQMASMQRDLIVLRQSGKDIQTSEIAGDETIFAPVINAGEGVAEHPTQALLDMFTIWEEFKDKKEISELRIGLYGDLAHGRTAHSLFKLATRMGATLVVISAIKKLNMPEEYIKDAIEQGAKIEMSDDIIGAAPSLDVLYTTRLQRERIRQDNIDTFSEDSGYGITPNVLNALNENAILMHPLPSQDEYPEMEMDTEPRARHLQQAENGIWTRMALMKNLMQRQLMRPVF